MILKHWLTKAHNNEIPYQTIPTKNTTKNHTVQPEICGKKKITAQTERKAKPHCPNAKAWRRKNRADAKAKKLSCKTRRPKNPREEANRRRRRPGGRELQTDKQRAAEESGRRHKSEASFRQTGSKLRVTGRSTRMLLEAKSSWVRSKVDDDGDGALAGGQ